GVGWLQSRTFGWKARWRLLWITATTSGVAAGWPIFFAFHSGSVLWASTVAYRPFVFPAKLFLCGLIIGLLQMMVLAFKTSRAWLWLPTCAGAFVLAGSVAAMLEASVSLLALLVFGTTFGVLTGLPMAWILQSRSWQWSGSTPD